MAGPLNVQPPQPVRQGRYGPIYDKTDWLRGGRAPTFDPESIGQQVEQYQDFAREGVEAYGRQLQPHLMREIGTALGGLNSIGALRSGGTTVAMEDIADRYTEQIGNFAGRATMDAIGFGQQGAFGTYDRQRQAYDTDRDFDQRERARRDARRGALMGSIGQLLGAGIGFALPPAAPVAAAATR